MKTHHALLLIFLLVIGSHSFSYGALPSNPYMVAAETGRPQAQFELGFRYMTGQDGIQRDWGKAREWLMKAAEQDYSKAQMLLSTLYADGLGVAQDYEESIRWLQKAVQKKTGGVGYNLESGQLAVVYSKLGECFLFGKGVKEDQEKGLGFYSKAAELGYAEAEVQVGICYSEGWAVKKDMAEAVKWFEKAARKHDFGAFYLLGNAYKNGEGVPQNFVEAYKWYILATAVGNVSSNTKPDTMQSSIAVNALRDRNNLAKQMTPEQIADAQSRAEKYFASSKK